jgi:hypothetical protein
MVCYPIFPWNGLSLSDLLMNSLLLNWSVAGWSAFELTVDVWFAPEWSLLNVLLVNGWLKK